MTPAGAWFASCRSNPDAATTRSSASPAAQSVISVKGAPEIVLPRCVAVRDDGRTRALDEPTAARSRSDTARSPRQGYRVLAVAERTRRATPRSRRGPGRSAGVPRPARPGRPDPADRRRRGDPQLRQCRRRRRHADRRPPEHRRSDRRPNSICSTAVAWSPGPSWTSRRQRPSTPGVRGRVFARVSPAHKVADRAALRQAGRVVAVTGDGANDAPAIRLADVGIALGDPGTAAARQAADMIVVDDRIETIADAVIEGRAMWASVRDAVGTPARRQSRRDPVHRRQLRDLGRPPLNARQFLFVNLMTDLCRRLAVAVRPPPTATGESLNSGGRARGRRPAGPLNT